MGGFIIMDWKLILRIAVIVTLMFLLASVVIGCKRDTSPIINWDDCSQEVGDHPCDFTLMDQKGNEFNLYDHHGKIIILDFSAMWCGPCMMAATEVEDLQKRYGDDIVYVTVLIENQNHKSPTKNDLKKWADHFGIELAPVLGGNRSMISSNPKDGWPITAWPSFFIIDQNMVLVESFKGFSRGMIETIILTNLKDDTGSP